jgi:hypothetical protein
MFIFSVRDMRVSSQAAAVLKAGRGRHQAPPKIPFEGFDHDFSAAGDGPGEKPNVSIAGASRSNSLLPAEALGPLAH